MDDKGRVVNPYLEDIVVWDESWNTGLCKKCNKEFPTLHKPEQCPYCKVKNNPYQVTLDKI